MDAHSVSSNLRCSGDTQSESLSLNEVHVQDLQFNDSNSCTDGTFSSEYSLCSVETKGTDGKSSFTPIVDKFFQPYVGKEVGKLDEAINWYDSYAKRAGFDCKLGSERKIKGILVYKYMYCSRGGEVKTKSSVPLTGVKRKRFTKKINCPAYIGFKRIGSTENFLVLRFHGVHNHQLFTKDTEHNSREKRQLDFYDKSVIYRLSKSNFGPSEIHAVVTGLKGGYDMQGPKYVDYKNWSRDLKCYVKDSDAQTLCDLMAKRKLYVPKFSFEFFTIDNFLYGCFWADAIGKRNFKEFGDVISFDATFRTNKYGMVFVPFTGIDNHKKSVTFGAALLGNETAQTYIWLLKEFLKAFGVQPKIVVTDQCLSMSKAISVVFPQSTHRLCMWHIMKKIKDKVCPKLLAVTDFQQRLQNIVWNSYLEPSSFEEKWISLIEEFNLNDNLWLKDMFKMRNRWIPAFFKGVQLSGLMRTTSLSESQNFFFQSFLSKDSNLLEFMMKFDTAMDKQRHKQSFNDYDSVVAKIPTLTPISFEVEASNHYTLKMFKIVQDEIYDSVWTCAPAPKLHSSSNGNDVYDLIERPFGETFKGRSSFLNLNSSNEKVLINKEFRYKVLANDQDEEYKCSCMAFEHYGILCRHIFCILRIRFAPKVPSKFFLRRWQKDIINLEDLRKSYSIGDNGNGCERKVQELYSVLAECVSLTSHDNEAMDSLLEQMKKIKDNILLHPPQKDSRSKSQVLDSLVGIERSTNVTVLNPLNVRTKGCGSGGKRLKGQKEIATEAAEKDKRGCSFCNKKKVPIKDKHDFRNCPLRKEMGIK